MSFHADLLEPPSVLRTRALEDRALARASVKVDTLDRRCALPALRVALGAGAALSGLISAVPQIVWLSANKAAVFGVAGAMLAIAGVLQWRARFAPCPADPVLASTCVRARRASTWIYRASVAIFILGALFAFVLPRF